MPRVLFQQVSPFWHLEVFKVEARRHSAPSENVVARLDGGAEQCPSFG
ncbi:uncharacterized protein METZ01_LOCUS443959 [marine metagenome]|uniref:Uncharacterized protein n=1 Tax=marine metagenome TaxID=408172 RepID=A0A382Z7M1_9ZZZZ